jgi:hypothetical protein
MSGTFTTNSNERGTVMEILTSVEYERFLEIERDAQALVNKMSVYVISVSQKEFNNLKAALKPLDMDALQ